MGGRKLRWSQRSSLRWLLVLGYAAVIFWLSHQPQLPTTPGGDKTAHVVAYAGLGFLLALALAPGRTVVVRTLSAWAIGSLYGISDEWHQSFVPGRDASAADMLADMIGSGVGALSFVVWMRFAIWLYGGRGGVSNGIGTAVPPSKEAS